MARGGGRRLRGKKEKPTNLPVLRKHRTFMRHTQRNFPMIIEIPLHPKSRRPIMSKMRVERRGLLTRGYHIRWFLIKYNPNKRQYVQREIVL